MKKQNTFTQKTIVADTAEEFDLKMNAVLDAAFDPEIIYKQGEKFCAIVKMPRVIEHKCISEIYEERGEGHLCGECIYFDKPTDRRIKYTKCTHRSHTVCYGDRACNLFYELLEEGREVLRND